VGCAQRRPTPRDHFLIYCASHLIYSTISPLPLTKYSNFITESYHIRLVPQKSLHKIRILNSAKAFTILSCRRFVLHISPTRAWRINKSPSAEPHAGGRHTYDGVLLGAPKGSFVTLLSPHQCHAAFDIMLHTLALVNKSPVCHPRTLPPSTTRTPCKGAAYYAGSHL